MTHSLSKVADTSITMTQFIGDFRKVLPPNHEFLLLGFSASETPLQKRWRNNGLSANFVADYLTTFFPLDDETISKDLHGSDVKGAVSYIANELLENAMKFSIPDAQCPIRFSLHLLTEDAVTIILSTTNSIARQSVEPFQVFINELLTADLDDLYMRQVENSASEDEWVASGLGLITMKNDYAAKLGWKFEPIDHTDEAIALTTMVQLRV